jgi:hypothetical protein
MYLIAWAIIFIIYYNLQGGPRKCKGIVFTMLKVSHKSNYGFIEIEMMLCDEE